MSYTLLKVIRSHKFLRMSSTLSTIDFGRFLNGSYHDRQQVAAEIDRQFQTKSTFYLINHGMDERSIDMYFNLSKQFFSFTNEEKEKLSPARSSLMQGYYGMEKEKIRDHLCWKENFDFGNPKDDQIGFWPTEEQLPGFRENMANFFQDCTRLTEKVLECLSMALGLNHEDSLGQYHTGSLFVCSLLHYPAVDAQLLRSGELVRNPAHSDLSTVTFLFQRNVGGLEVADMSSTKKTTSAAVEKSAHFIPVDPKPGVILVKVGHPLMRWTNSRWKNTVHRVSAPPHKQTADDNELFDMVPERYSIAFFSYPDAETTIAPFSICCTDQKPKWAPINAGDYLSKKRRDLYSNRLSSSPSRRNIQ